MFLTNIPLIESDFELSPATTRLHSKMFRDDSTFRNKTKIYLLAVQQKHPVYFHDNENPKIQATLFEIR